ncbi:unnamed protein product [Vitrella brassicaformis CCMP3155]|uniref:Uncharacterized protein n=1 Tax=Vitrella brassicaformis (strain CCMP3155) TaxID=1169540 RepID=A0A0G4EVU7_VITBC|nr:unnamed protein product [Vitrella brassicaformis CCMP3155]|mmetsp:Transcript_13723/g.32670  ORF Transcript_13723/g.32670 Transcript_13723/m.32670 type:complete len:210 (-) Transcript_13723:1497-2126(-)|eukprot:CEM02552.1 unnamed protein product [Vitrella brassicaformis CCMP3155]
MMKLMVFAALIAAASAFVPSAPLRGLDKLQSRDRTAPRMAVEDMIGADVETRGVWDPLGFSKDESSLYRYRAVELKHGRVAMLAVLGYFVAELWHPLYDGKVEPGLKAISQVPSAGWLQILATIAAIELSIGKQDFENRAPGDLGFGINPFENDPVEFAKLQLKEIKNGRLAMIAIAGMLVQELVTGQTTLQQLREGHISPFGDGQGLF